MFMGVTAHHSAKSVHDYATAEAALERAMKTPTGKRRTEKPYGYHLGANNNHGVTWVRRDEKDGAIAFRLYDTDVVTWHPDGSVEIENYGTVTTSGFASRFLPRGFHLHHPTTRRGDEVGHRGIRYQAEPDRGDKSWQQERRERRIAFGGVVRFTPGEGGAWRVDEDTCDTVTLPGKVDQRKARELAKRYHLKDFEAWLSMAPRHMDIEHVGRFDISDCLDLLEKRNFKEAAAYLPLFADKESYGRYPTALPIDTPYGKVVTMGSLARLKLALWDYEDIIQIDEAKHWSMAEFERRMMRVRQMDAAGANVWDLGPQR